MKKVLKLTTLLALFLLLLAACGGGADEALEESGESDTTEEMDEASDSETIGDGDIGATGSEEDSGEIPPTPQPGGKVETDRATPDPSSADLVAANSTPTPEPANRIDSAETAVLPPLDFVLLMDTTGSMATELSQLQASLTELTTSLTAIAETSNLRLGLVTYRDIGKEEAIQVYEFTEDPSLFTNQLANVTAVGGGDYPEALSAGFDQAMNNLAWRTNATKVVILLGDAPPQAGSANTPTLEEINNLATENNVTIFTIGSDGLNATGAEIYAQIAQNGNGRFIFLTDNPDSSIGNPTAVYPTAQLATALTDIVEEVLNAQAP